MLKRTAAFWLAFAASSSAPLFAQGIPGAGCGCAGGSPPVFAPLAPLMVPPLPPICPTAAGGYGPMPLGQMPAYPMAQPDCSCASPLPAMPVLPPPMMQTTMRPVYETRMKQENFTTYENVARTEVRREQFQVAVPVTTQKQVTVDEGSYQMVWVSRPVTKTIAETSYRQETRFRDVPYQVVQTVPRQMTRMVPEQTVRYVPETRVVQGFPTCYPQTAFGPAIINPAPVNTAPSITPVPDSSQQAPVVPSPYEASGQAPSTGSQPASPAQTSDNSDWTTIKQRTASKDGIELQSYEQFREAGPASTAAPKRLFSPVPSAAAVWQSQIRR